MYETVKFNVFEENPEETVYRKESENQTENAETIQLQNEQNDDQTSRRIANRNYKKPVFRRFDWEREGTLNVL
jgi:hypothetical protein